LDLEKKLSFEKLSKHKYFLLLLTDVSAFNTWHIGWRTTNPGKQLDLSGSYLAYADLRGADLRGADLHESDLCFADLHGAELDGADLRDALLDGAKFDQAPEQLAKIRNLHHAIGIHDLRVMTVSIAMARRELRGP